MASGVGYGKSATCPSVIGFSRYRGSSLPQVGVKLVVSSIIPRQFSASDDALSGSSLVWASGCCSSIISHGRNPPVSIGSLSGIAAEVKDQLQQATVMKSGLNHGQLGIRLLFE